MEISEIFMKECKRKGIANNLAFVLLYGSRVEGHCVEGSDYDLIVVLKEKKELDEKFIEEMKKRKIDIVYWIDIDSLKDKIRRSISMYSVLKNKTHEVIYSTDDYNKIMKFVNEHVPDIKLYKKGLLNKREFLINALKEREGRKAGVWAYHSIRSLLQVISLSEGILTRDMLTLINFLKEEELMEKEEIEFLEKLTSKVAKREKIDEKEKKVAENILRRLYKILEKDLT